MSSRRFQPADRMAERITPTPAGLTKPQSGPFRAGKFPPYVRGFHPRLLMGCPFGADGLSLFTMSRVDAAELEIFKNLFHSVAEEMGAALRRSAFSPNIKERRDYSCAVFDGQGRVAAMGDHMPVHLGSMPMSVAAALEALELAPGDIAMLNDPYAGGTHLPDITLVMPVVPPHKTAAKPRRKRQPVFYVANRAHHSDIGGAQPASMGLSEDIYQEGLRIPPVALVREGVVQRDVLALLLANVRTPAEREGDLMAQVAACRLGERRLIELLEGYGVPKIRFYLEALQGYSARLMRQALLQIPDGTYAAEDFLDDDGFSDKPVPLRVSIRIRHGQATVDFAGSSPACRGSVNAVMAITISAVFYVFRCLLGEEVPACAGLMEPIEVRAPGGSVVNAKPPAAVAAGNVETSQRIVDVLLRALAKALPHRIPAASSGTMNNLSFGGLDPRTGAALCLLRNDWRGNGCPSDGGWFEWSPHPHDELTQYAHRGARSRLPRARAALLAAPRLRRPRAFPWG